MMVKHNADRQGLFDVDALVSACHFMNWDQNKISTPVTCFKQQEILMLVYSPLCTVIFRDGLYLRHERGRSMLLWWNEYFHYIWIRFWRDSKMLSSHHYLRIYSRFALCSFGNSQSCHFVNKVGMPALKILWNWIPGAQCSISTAFWPSRRQGGSSSMEK